MIDRRSVRAAQAPEATAKRPVWERPLQRLGHARHSSREHAAEIQRAQEAALGLLDPQAELGSKLADVSGSMSLYETAPALWLQRYQSARPVSTCIEYPYTTRPGDAGHFSEETGEV
ncbi:MAG: hypothetical protein C4289_00675 [Chloroflexota bacterium]